jgi:pimeloyl-ACP methyl ester carboxylesterase
MAGVTTQRVEVNGALLDVRERGAGEPVLFVHGGMGDECAAVVNEPALTERFRVIDYHQRGWGNSTWPEGPYSNGLAVSDCLGVMRHLGIERSHMAGQSGGGRILLQLALDAPETVQSLAVLEPALPSVLENPAFVATAEKMGALYGSGDKAGAIEAFAREVGGPDFDGARAAMDKTLPPGYWERWVAAADTLFRMFGGEPWTFTREDAAGIKCPVLNVRGADTRPYFREVYDTVAEWLPHAENFVLPNANHCMLQMNPRGAAERLADFFSQHPMAA